MPLQKMEKVVDDVVVVDVHVIVVDDVNVVAVVMVVVSLIP